MKNLIRFFFWGIIASGAALLIETSVAIPFSIDFTDTNQRNQMIFIIGFVLIEEVIRYIVLIYNNRYLASLKNHALSGAFVGLGFALAEMGLTAAFTDHWSFRLEMLAPILVHVWSGLVIGVAIFFQKRTGLLFISLLIIAVITHAGYNLVQASVF